MSFSFAVKKLDDQVVQTLRALDDSKRLYQDEGINQPELLETVTQTRETLDNLRASLRGILAANERRFDMIEFLTEALKMEHNAIAELQSCLRVIPDQQLQKTLNELLMDENKHEEALARRITALGGEPRVAYEAMPRPENISILDLLHHHRDEELKTQRHYELGLSRFEEPEFQWILGQLNIEEQGHLAKLDEVIEKYRSADVIPPELKNIRWVDPYMGPPGDRAWIE